MNIILKSNRNWKLCVSARVKKSMKDVGTLSEAPHNDSYVQPI